MKSGGPWNLRGLRPETLAAARDAARRSGLSVGEWLNDLIEESEDYGRAALALADPAYSWPDDTGDDYRGSARTPRRDYDDHRSRGARDSIMSREQLHDVQARLDQLTDQLEQVMREKPPLRGAPMRPTRRNWRGGDLAADQGAPRIAEQTSNRSQEPELPLPPTAPQLAPEAGQPEPPLEFPELEEQLRRITAQIEALRSTGLDSVIATFRSDLADIRRQLTEALPRQAVESLCVEVEALARRIDRSREWTGDSDAIAGIERGLAEIRDALRGMTTAESLIGFDEALKTLAQKLDLIIAREDPTALRQLETAIGALRGIVAHVASNDALSKVAEDVRHLAAKIDSLAKGAASGQAVSALGSRIDNLTDALNASAEVAGPRGLERLLSGVMEKLDSLRLGANDPAFKRLEERIGQLIGRLDASDARLGNITAVERGVTDLLAHMEKLRSAESAPAAASARPAVVAIARDVAEIKRSEQRTQDSLEAVHGTVEQVVDRLAMIESDIHDATLRSPRSQMPTQPASETARPAVPAPTPAGGAPTAAELVTPSERQDFIAAARRATQAATAPVSDDETRSRSRRRRGRSSGSGDTQTNKPFGLRKLLVAAGIVVLTVSCLQIALHFFQDERPAGEAAAPWQHPAEPTSPPDNTTAPPRSGSLPARKTATTAPDASLPAPVEPMQLAAPAPAAASDSDAAKPSAAQNLVPAAAAQSLSAPIVVPPSPPSAGPTAAVAPPSSLPPQSGLPNTVDSTGSLPRTMPAPAADAPPAPSASSAAMNEADALPPAIGGASLRAAAIAGDMAAQYEIGVRFGEGRGVPRNERQAAYWLDLAAKQGLAPAQFRLGGYYERGIGVKKDLATARDLYLAAAAKGNAKAMHNLGVLYGDGINGRSDYRSAALWFRKAADRGIADSQYNLAILYARGSGEPQNNTEAYKWFALAAKQGDVEAANKRDELAAQLDDATLATAELAVRGWKPEPQPDEAVKVKIPPGGWDGAVQPARPKPRTKSAKLGGSASQAN